MTVRDAGAPGDAERLAREAEPEFDVIAAAGGDGTLNAVANGIAARPRPVAILPFGTVNLLARELGLPRDPEDLAKLVARGAPRLVWPGCAGDRLFLTVASAGMDADVVAALDPTLKARFGRLAFLPALLPRFLDYGAHQILAEIDGAEQHRAALVIVAKGRYYAGPFVAAPAGRVADPVLYAVLLAGTRRIDALRYAAALLHGGLHRYPGVIAKPAHRIALTAAQPVRVQADGDVVGRLPMRFGVSSSPIPFIAPEM